MSDTFHGQGAIFADTVLQHLPQLSGPDLGYWIDHPEKLQLVLKQALANSHDVLATTKQVLRRVRTVVLPERTDAFCPKAFYQTRKGLYVEEAFCEQIVAVTRRIESVPVAKIVIFDLLDMATHSEIRDELPELHVFEDASMFCAHLAGMIRRQRWGKQGRLLGNGHANNFFVLGREARVFAVRVSSDSFYKEWQVRTRPMNDRAWDAGQRVFSRAR